MCIRDSSPCTHPDLEQEQRKQVQTALIVALSASNYVENYSSLSKLIRVFSYCHRFIRNSRIPTEDRNLSFLTSHELHGTLLVFIRQSQKSHFEVEINKLEEQRCIPNNSKILSLHPFMDKSGILRVGGCLLYTSNRHAIANNPLIPDHYDVSKPTSFLSLIHI